MTTTPAPTVTIRIVLWPTEGDPDFTGTVLEQPLGDATAEEARFFAEQYADVPLLDLWRRLRLAEWNAAEFQRQAEQAQKAARQLPPLHAIRELDARHRRVRELLEAPGSRAIPRAELRAALTESTIPTP